MPFTINEFTGPIVEHWQARKGNLVVNAVAGSGKTTLLEYLCSMMSPEEQKVSIFVAFNRHIVDELKQRLPAGVQVKTINSLGGSILNSVLWPIKTDIPGYKYRELVDQYCTSHIPDGLPEDERRTPTDVKQAIVTLVEKSMCTLSDYHNADVLEKLVSRFNVEIDPPSGYVAPVNGDLWDFVYRAVPVIIDNAILEIRTALRNKDLYAKQQGDSKLILDFIDQIYMPIALKLRIPNRYQFRNILVDESQDLNPAQRELILMCCAEGARTCWVGDRKQAIYAFAGADSASIDRIIEMTGATEMPLSVCWRCPTSHIAAVQPLVPQIQAAPTAIAGIEDEITHEKLATTVKIGDTIMCRCTAPLVEVAFDLIRKGLPAKVKGRDIGKSLTAILKRIEKMPGFKSADFAEEFLNYLKQYEDRAAQGIRSNNKYPDMLLQALEDKCATIEHIFHKVDEECCAHNLASIEAEIERIFADAIDGRCVQLCTIHKAKGLQGPRMFIIRPDLLMHKMAKSAEEIQQERNLAYIAMTRSQEYICWVKPPPL